MISKMYTVYDSKAEAYLVPFFLQSKGQALRAFQDLANDPKHNFCKHASDFTLFEIGEYDDLSGHAEMYRSKISLGLAAEFKKSNVNMEA